MKKILLLLFVGFTTLSVNAQKELTLEDAVMNQYRNYYPESTTFFMWIPNTQDYSFLSADYQTLLRGNSKNDKTVELINTSELAKIMGGQPRYVNVVEWKDENSFYTLQDAQYWLINIEDKKGTSVGMVPNSAEGSELSLTAGDVAFNSGPDLYLSSCQHQFLKNEKD